MAKQDFSKLLGKRVGYQIDTDDGPLYFKGLVVGIMKYLEGYEDCCSDYDVFWIEDGYDEPDFISSDREFHILD